MKGDLKDHRLLQLCFCSTTNSACTLGDCTLSAGGHWQLEAAHLLHRLRQVQLSFEQQCRCKQVAQTLRKLVQARLANAVGLSFKKMSLRSSHYRH